LEWDQAKNERRDWLEGAGSKVGVEVGIKAKVSRREENDEIIFYGKKDFLWSPYIVLLLL
jgi:hypothetical protein